MLPIPLVFRITFSLAVAFALGQSVCTAQPYKIETFLDTNYTYQNDGPWNVNGLSIGVTADGSMMVKDGGEVVNTGSGYLGDSSTGIGTATVTGQDSLWSSSSNLFIGNAGMGTLNITDGGKASSGPSSSFDTFIGNQAGSSGTVNVSGADSMGTGSLFEVAGDLNVGNSGAGALNIGAGGNVTSLRSYIGNNSGSVGTAKVDGAGASWTTVAQFNVGDGGTGTLDILNGGTVTTTNSSYNLAIGRQAGSTGTVNVSGVGSLLDKAGALNVGREGTGTLNVENGGSVESSSSNVGYLAGSEGTVNVQGNGSLWKLGSLNVGSRGKGTLNILDGGQVDTSASGSSQVGAIAGSEGTVNVSGDGSLWTDKATNDVQFGGHGKSTLNVLDGGKVDFNATKLGVVVGSVDTANISGTGSMMVTTSFAIGGSADLNITDGGKVSSTISTLGDFASANISDAGSEWNLSSQLTVQGDLEVLNGGVLLSNNGIVSSATNSSSPEATVSGAGSRWENSQSLSVGRGGTGVAVLDVLDGGVVTSVGGSVGGAYISGAYVGSALATVSGTGSLWNTSGQDLLVGASGIGVLNIDAGGRVVSSEAIFGHIHGDGTINVSGSQSHFDVSSGRLTIGNSGKGSLNISDGGTVNSDLSFIGMNTNSTIAGGGTVSVIDAGSHWENTGGLNVGHGNTGTLDIKLGALVSNTDGLIGFNGNGVGTVTVQSGSMWNNSGDLTVGRQGTGTLNIETGSTVNNVNAIIGQSTSGSNLGIGTVNVSGTGSSWNTANDMSVGGYISPSGFSGELNISDNATVNVGGTMKLFAPGGVTGSTGGAVNFSGGKLDVSTLDLTAVGATGKFNMTGGRLVADTILGNFEQKGGTLAPGDSPGFTNVQGDYHMMAGTIEFELGGEGALGRGLLYDAINVSGTATFDGTMDVNFINGFSALEGDSFHLVNVGGAFGAILGSPMFDFSGANLSSGLKWDTSEFLANGSIFVTTSVPEPTSFLMFGIACSILIRRRKNRLV